MLGFDRKAARHTWTAALVLLLLYIIYMVRTTLFVFTLALLFAYLLSPLVNLLNRVLPVKRAHNLALALTYIIFIGGVIIAGAKIGGQVAEQAKTLGQKLPEMLEKWHQPSPNSSEGVNDLKARIIESVQSEVGGKAGDLLGLVPNAGMMVLSVAGNLIFVVLVPVFGFFFLKDAGIIRSHVLELVDPGPWRALVENLMKDAHLLLARYMRALVLLAFATFVAYSISFVIMGIPFAILLAVLGMMLEIIPTIGPLVAAAAILAVTAVSGGNLLAVLIFIIIYRMFQDYVLSPFLMGQGVELHPLLVLFGVFAGAEIAGVAGSFISVPVLAMARIIYLHIRRSRLAGHAAALTAPLDISPVVTPGGTSIAQ